MKKGFKKLLLTSLILFLLGIVLCSVALICAAVKDVDLFENSQSVTTEDFSVKLSDIEKKGTLDFTKLYIHGEDIDVTVRSTDKESYIQFVEPDKSKTSCIIENGILKITDTVPFYILGLSVTDLKPKFTGFRNIFTSGIYSTTDKAVTVYLNENVSVNSIEVKVGIGTIDITDVSAKNITVSTVVGDVKLDENKISEKASVNCSVGDVSIDECSYAFADIATITGNITVHSLGRKTNCEATVGDITVLTEDDPYSYSTRATTTSGKVMIDGTVMPEKDMTASADSESTLWLKTTLGDISLYNSVTNE